MPWWNAGARGEAPGPGGLSLPVHETAGPGRAGAGGATRWVAVLVLMAAGVVAAAQIGKGAAALPVLQADLGLGASAAAWFLSVFSALGAALGAVLGWLGQAVGFRRQIQVGLAVVLVANAAGAAVHGTAGLLTARVGEGLGFVLVVLAAPGLLPGVAAPAQRRAVVGAWGAYMPVGSGLAALLVPPSVAAVGWRGTWLLEALLAGCALLAVGRGVPAGPRRGRPVTGGLVRAVRAPGVLTLAAVFGLYAGQYLAVLGLLPAMLVGGGGLSLTAAGVVGGIAFLANAPGNLLGAWLQHRGVPRWRLVAGGCACMAVTVWGVLDPALPLAVRVASALAFSSTAGVVPSAAFGGVAATTAGTDAAGAAVGLLMQGSSVGQLLVPPLVVAVGAAVRSWAAGAATVCCLAVLGVLGSVLYRRQETHVVPAPAVPGRS